MEKINSYLFKKRAQNYLSSSTRERRFVSYDKAKTVLLLFESDFSEKNPEIRKIIYSLQHDGKKVVACGFIDKKEVTTAILPDFRILNNKQTDFFRKPQIGFINELEELTFDLMIDLTLHQIIPLEYFALFANAACKTGLRKTDLPIYDFAIEIENKPTISDETESTQTEIDENYLFNQIIFYLKSIQTND
jgi:hypothetical protein